MSFGTRSQGRCACSRFVATASRWCCLVFQLDDPKIFHDICIKVRTIISQVQPHIWSWCFQRLHGERRLRLCGLWEFAVFPALPMPPHMLCTWVQMGGWTAKELDLGQPPQVPANPWDWSCLLAAGLNHTEPERKWIGRIPAWLGSSLDAFGWVILMATLPNGTNSGATTRACWRPLSLKVPFIYVFGMLGFGSMENLVRTISEATNCFGFPIRWQNDEGSFAEPPRGSHWTRPQICGQERKTEDGWDTGCTEELSVSWLHSSSMWVQGIVISVHLCLKVIYPHLWKVHRAIGRRRYQGWLGQNAHMLLLDNGHNWSIYIIIYICRI